MPVTRMCRFAGLARSGYYAWRQRTASPHTRADERLLVEIRAIHAASRQTYGSPRIHADLHKQGIRCSRNRVARLMRQSGIAGLRRGRRRVGPATGSQNYPAAPNRLGRNFAIAEPNRVWLVDITEVHTREGVLYVGVVLDLYSRRIVGWQCSDTGDTALARSALQMGLGRRRPRPGLIHHSDQGSQYAWPGYVGLLEQHELVASMSRKGNPYDNAPMESWMGTLKVELVYRTSFETRAGAQELIAEYIELFYNSRRRHSALGYLSPVEYERQHGHA
jgi:putative transposase